MAQQQQELAGGGEENLHTQTPFIYVLLVQRRSVESVRAWHAGIRIYNKYKPVRHGARLIF
jgi:hypothetical protein